MSAVSDALAEVVAALAAMALPHEGFRDLALLDIQPGSLHDVQLSIEQFDRRKAFLETVQIACEQLIDDGYPELAPRQIQDSELNDLREQAASIAAALALFTSGGAAAMRFSGGTPTPKA